MSSMKPHFSAKRSPSGPEAGTTVSITWAFDRREPRAEDYPDLRPDHPALPGHARGARPVTFDEWLGRDSWDLLPPGWG
ncbi:hypothetical protein [Streptomyces sp. CB01580]|uniref:hypothetical protein n=1 Tax=Streptomyces sp. CB01580 TaxID=1703933 RepID=UPI0018FEFC01